MVLRMIEEAGKNGFKIWIFILDASQKKKNY